MDGSDGVVSEEEEEGEDQDEIDLTDGSLGPRVSNCGQRLSFMFEHNNFMNMRIQALVCDLRNNNLLEAELNEAETPSPSSASRPRRSRVGSKVTLNVPEGDEPKLSRNSSQTSVTASVAGDPDSRSSFPKKQGKNFSGGRQRKNSVLPPAIASDEQEKKISELERRSAELEQLLKTSVEAKNAEGGEPGSPSVREAVARGSEAADRVAREREKEESSRLRKQVAEMRAELDTERKRANNADKDNANLRRDLKKCQHVIERLVKELEMATRTVAQPQGRASEPTKRPSTVAPAVSSEKRKTVTDTAGVKRSTVSEQSSKMPPSAGDLEQMIRRDMERQEAPAQPGFMQDLSSAIGAFFGQLGTAKPANAPSDMETDEWEEPFCWADDPHGSNVDIDEDGQTASFIGKEKTALHAYVVTEEPPLLEADQGYGFEVLIKKVRTGQEDGLAIGFTATPPDMWPEELPETADLIEQSFLVGYNGEMYDGGTENWTPCPWSPAHLSEGDRVGVQVSQEGKFFVVVNQKVVFSTSIPIQADGPPLFGVVDLLGNTDAVTLLD
jgi:hypothetical protein